MKPFPRVMKDSDISGLSALLLVSYNGCDLHRMAADGAKAIATQIALLQWLLLSLPFVKPTFNEKFELFNDTSTKHYDSR